MKIKIRKPSQKNYIDIVKLVNSAEEIFFSIRTPEVAKLLRTSELSVEDLIKDETDREYLSIFKDDKICAFISYRFKNKQTLWVSMLYVNLSNQGNGYGSMLLSYVENIARDSGVLVSVLETDRKAYWAVNFYKKLGYKDLSGKDIKKYPFDMVLDKDPVKFRYLFGKEL